MCAERGVAEVAADVGSEKNIASGQTAAESKSYAVFSMRPELVLSTYLVHSRSEVQHSRIIARTGSLGEDALPRRHFHSLIRRIASVRCSSRILAVLATALLQS